MVWKDSIVCLRRYGFGKEGLVWEKDTVLFCMPRLLKNHKKLLFLLVEHIIRLLGDFVGVGAHALGQEALPPARLETPSSSSLRLEALGPAAIRRRSNSKRKC